MNLIITPEEIKASVVNLHRSEPHSTLLSAASKGVELVLSKLKKSWRVVDVKTESLLPGDLYLFFTTATWIPAVEDDGTVCSRVVSYLENAPQQLIIKRQVLSIDDVPPPQEPTLLKAAKDFVKRMPFATKLLHAHDLMAAIEREESNLKQQEG